MTKNIYYIIAGGIVLTLACYIIFYTPLSDMIFGIKQVKYAAQQNFPLISEKVKPTEPLKFSEIPLRNPFTIGFAFEKSETPAGSPEAVKKPAATFVLQGVFELPTGARAAIIDDRMVSEGQKIYNWTITRIQPDRAILSRGGKTKVLRLKLGVD